MGYCPSLGSIRDFYQESKVHALYVVGKIVIDLIIKKEEEHGTVIDVEPVMASSS